MLVSQRLLGTVQVGVHSGLQRAAEALLLSITQQSSVGNALAALLNTDNSKALLSALEEAVRRANGAPIIQVRISCGLSLKLNSSSSSASAFISARHINTEYLHSRC